jgi:hypothetical protein
MKTCKTCVHYRASWLMPSLSQCAAVENPVTGGPGAYCGIEREGGGVRTGCGRDGSKWQPAPATGRPWWAFWRR